MNLLNIDSKFVSDVLQRFLKEEVTKTGFEKVILGLSGGVDSTVVAYLCALAFPAEAVTALIMPYRTSNPKNMEHAELVAKKLKIKYEICDISPMVDGFFKDDPDADMLRRGNRMARERMCFLYDYSAKQKSMVIGTSNKTELLLGYGTIFGDLASAINPIGDLYKSQIWELAEYLGVPKEIIKKPPSADLWVGQTDEDEIGYSYEQIDELLHYMIDHRYSNDMLLDQNFAKEMINKIQKMIQSSQFKRRPPIIAKLSNRTINQDFRYCRDWGV
ncbi:MAG: NAD+ synthase [Calditrichia bacterium]|nr:NAD+ synthase [Calditrichia bacterium]